MLKILTPAKIYFNTGYGITHHLIYMFA